MIFNNSELVEIKDSTIDILKSAICELEGVEEYKDIYNSIDDIIDELEEVAKIYEEAYEEESKKDRDYENNEYYKNTFPH